MAFVSLFEQECICLAVLLCLVADDDFDDDNDDDGNDDNDDENLQIFRLFCKTSNGYENSPDNASDNGG